VIVEWDDKKALSNKRKHGVSFEEAVAALEDPLSITFHDPDHSLDEGRFLTFGHDSSGRILMVAHNGGSHGSWGRRSADLGQACHTR